LSVPPVAGHLSPTTGLHRERVLDRLNTPRTRTLDAAARAAEMARTPGLATQVQPNALHVPSALSPAATARLAIGDWLANRAEQTLDLGR